MHFRPNTTDRTSRAAGRVFNDSPVDEIEVRGQVVGLEVAEETRKILLKENLEGCKILQHLTDRQKKEERREVKVTRANKQSHC